MIFVGFSELAEIAAIRSHDLNIAVLGTYDPTGPWGTLFGKPVWAQLEALPACDAAVLTALNDCAARYAEVLPLLGPARIVVPELVRPLLQLSEAQA